MPQTKKKSNTTKKTRELEVSMPRKRSSSAAAKPAAKPAARSASGSSAKRSPSKSAAEAAAYRRSRRSRPEHLDEIAGVIFIALGIVIGILTYAHTSAIFEKVVEFMFGLFGVIQYAVPVVLVVLGILLIAMPRRQIGKGFIALIAGAILCADCIIHVASFPVADSTFKDYIARGFDMGVIHRGGGWVSSIPAYGLSKLISAPGAIVVFAALALILIMLATSLSIRSAGRRIVAKADAIADRRKAKRYEQSEEEYVPAVRERRRPGDIRVGESSPGNTGEGLRIAEGAESLSEGLAAKKRGRSRMKVEEATLDSILENAQGGAKAGQTLDILPKSGKLPPSAPSRRKLKDPIVSRPEPNYPPEESIPDYDPFETIEIVPEDNITGETVADARPLTEPAPAEAADAPAPAEDTPAAEVQEPAPVRTYQKPPITLLRQPDRSEAIANDSPAEKAKLLIETLASFNISAKVTNISVGPVITRFEIQPAQGVRVNRITSLSNDIALALAAPRVRIEAPIPGKAAVGIEIPNKDTAMVRLREVIDTREFSVASSPLTFALGKDIAGKPVYANLERMPHMLIAGATGSGKSVCINSILLSTVYKATPDEVRMILIDPKVVELSIFAPMPHLYCPIVTDPRKAAGVLKWACNEMDQRYSKMSKLNARDLARYNSLQEKPEDRLPRLMIVIDELADLMIVSAKDVEDSIARLAQLGRACGIHLIVATQRPSVDVLTGLIKANIPSRIAFAVSSAIDSRVILETGGAEKLLGHGDMLFHPNGAAKPIRAQGAYVDDEEVESIMKFFEEHNMTAPQDDRVLSSIPELTSSTGQGNGKQEDDLLPDAVRIVMDSGSASISMIQRRLRVGYARAARLVDIMEQMKLVSGFDGSKPRKVLIDEAGYARLFGGGYAPAEAASDAVFDGAEGSEDDFEE